MDSFKSALEKKVEKAQSNNFGIDNYDEGRFGKYVVPNNSPNKLIFPIKQIIKKAIGINNIGIDISKVEWLNKHINGLQRIYDNVDSRGKELLVDLVAYRHLGYKKVKLSRNNKEYWNALRTGNSLADKNDTYDPQFIHYLLEKLELGPIGYDIRLYLNGVGVATDFIFEQYAYKQHGKAIVEVEKGDVVIDAGACWGDTALYFAHKTGKNGKVYSFDFIPNNMKLFNLNKSFNPNLAEQIVLIDHPLSDKTGNKIYYKDDGPGSKIEFHPFVGHTGSTTTITIDDFVRNNSIAKVDFIKMDIEGAEPSALKGAIETIKRFKPKLAITIYHSIEDFVNIPNWILDLNLGYEIFIDHFTIHGEETVCFAKHKNS